MKKLVLFSCLFLWASYNYKSPHSFCTSSSPCSLLLSQSLTVDNSEHISAPIVASSEAATISENTDAFTDEVFSAENVQPKLHCEKKWGVLHFQGKPFVRYRIRANQFPEGKRFKLFVKWFNGEEVEVASYIANRRGHLLLEENIDDTLYALCPLKKGERIEFVMKSEEDPSLYIETSLVPFPLELKVRKNLELSLELQGQDGDSFRLQARGLDAGEAVELITSIQGSETAYSLVASDEGMLDFPLKLEIGDEVVGECVLKLVRGDQEIYFPFQAGKGALELAGGFVLEIR